MIRIVFVKLPNGKVEELDADDLSLEKVRHKSRDGVTQCRFSCAVWSNDGNKLTLINVQIEVCQHRRIGEGVFIGDAF